MGITIHLRTRLLRQIIQELYTHLNNIGESVEFLCIVGSLDDTMSPQEVLEALQIYNEKGTIYSEVYAHICDFGPNGYCRTCGESFNGH